MILPKSDIKFKTIILFLILFMTHPDVNFSQEKYGLKDDWKWEDLMNKAVMVNPSLIKSIDKLKTEISIQDARYIVKALSELDSAGQLVSLFDYYEKDAEQNPSVTDTVVKKFSTTEYHYTDDTEGLINSMNILTGLRNSFNPGKKFCFKGTNYLLQPIRNFPKNVEINFDYTTSEIILKYLAGEMQTESELMNYETAADVFYKKKQNLTGKNDLLYCLNKVTEDSPLFTLYKWVNPQSYRNFAGVSIYKDLFSDVLNRIRENELNIRYDIIKNIVKYFPDSVFVNITVKFQFGDFNFNSRNEKKTIVINLENFNDDYAYLVRYIIHELYKITEREVHLKIEGYVADNKDQDFLSLISVIQENGTANYAGPLGTETRPWDLLEKDFQLFNSTFHHLKNNHDKNITDSLIRAGFEGNAPFFTMATQMAYIIETTIGRNALTESVSLGPVSFFYNYIKAYKEYPEKIRKVFRFRAELEKKINALEKIFPETILRKAVNINKMKINREEKLSKTEEFFNSYCNGSNSELVSFLSGQILLESDIFSEASGYFLKGLKMKMHAGTVPCRIGNSFMEKKAFDEAIKFYDICIENEPENSASYELRGINYFYLNHFENSLSDFKKALNLNPLSDTAKEFIKYMNKDPK